MKQLSVISAACLALTACASGPNSISATYVSPATYYGLDCNQLQGELMRVSARVSEVTGQQQRAANSDAVAMGVGLVLFWPALFFLASDNNKKEELARLKGEYDALQQAASFKSCFAPQPAAPPANTAQVSTVAQPVTAAAPSAPSETPAPASLEAASPPAPVESAAAPPN